MVAHVGMVIGNYEDSIVKPGLFPCCGKEFPEGVVGISYCRMNLHCASRESFFIFPRYWERVMIGGGENSSHERFFHGCHLMGIVLQKWFVPYCPIAVEFRFSSETGIFLEIFTSVIFLKTDGLCKSVKPHAPRACAVEECSVVSFVF